MADARAPPGFEMSASLLRLGAKARVAASDVRHHRMGAAGRILQGDSVLFTRTPAIAVTCAGRQEPAEHTVLGMEDGQVLIRNHLDPAGACLPREVGNLGGIQVMGRGYARESQP